MGSTYEYASINESSTLAVQAGAELTDGSGKAVKFSSGKVVLATEGDEPAGIVLLSQDEPVKKDDTLTIQIKDIGFWKAGAAVSAGDFLTSGADGLCQKVAAGQYIFARALNSATAKGDFVNVQIINAGYAKNS